MALDGGLVSGKNEDWAFLLLLLLILLLHANAIATCPACPSNNITFVFERAQYLVHIRLAFEVDSYLIMASALAARVKSMLGEFHSFQIQGD